MSYLTLSKVSKSFGGHEVIKGVDLRVEQGEFTVFVGPSGCGKSTLLRMIAGLETITGGDVCIDGARVNDVDPSARGIAMVFQSYALYPHMTVAQNMGFALKYAGHSKAEIATRVGMAAQILGLDSLLARLPGQLSGGQRQRVAIGRTIVRDPKVFLFDEPLSNLDAELRVQMRIELARLHKRLGATVIYVTHDQVEAMTLADKIVVLRDGKIEQIGSPLDLYDRPVNMFVAGFLGSPKMNFLPAIVERGGLRLVDFPEVVLPLGVAQDLGARVSVGLRPELFGPSGEIELALTVDLTEYLGDETYVYVRLGGDQILTISTGNDRSVRAGDIFRPRFDPAAAHVFDADGLRLGTRPIASRLP